MRVDYSGLGVKSAEPFWRFIGCCLVSKPEILGSNPDLSDLSISFKINNQEVDLFRAWQLHNEPTPPVEASQTEQRTSTQVESSDVRLSNLERALDEIVEQASSHMAYVEEGTNNAISYASDRASDLAAEHARESVNDTFYENSPSFEMNCEFDEAVEELRSMINELREPSDT